MAIGNLGSLITFEVSTTKKKTKVLTFSKLSQKVSGRYSTQNIISKKPKTEFLGPDLRTLNFDIKLSAMHGVKPRKTMEKIEKAVENGKAYTFVLGGTKIGKNKWVITSMSESFDTVYSKGELVEATLSLSLQEYV